MATTWGSKGCPRCGTRNKNKYQCTACNTIGCRTNGCLGATAKCDICGKSGSKKAVNLP